MDNQLAYELNENLKRLLGSPKKKVKKGFDVDAAFEQIRLKYLRKNLNK